MTQTQVMTADEFMEAHGEQVCTALRSMVEFWEKGAKERTDEVHLPDAMYQEQVTSWKSILNRAEGVVAGEGYQAYRPDPDTAAH